MHLLSGNGSDNESTVLRRLSALVYSPPMNSTEVASGARRDTCHKIGSLKHRAECARAGLLSIGNHDLLVRKHSPVTFTATTGAPADQKNCT